MLNKKICFFFVFLAYLQFIYADEVRLDEISVTANSVSSKKSILNKNDLKKGLIWNERDLVKNETGVSVTEGGRGANNGYAIRGVESDRVSVKVDGIESAESFMPRFYYIKGFMNGNRNSTELENLSSVEFTKGANSLTSGSGAIGGSVSMRTKTADDFVLAGKDYGFYLKGAYSSRNSEFKQIMGGGVKHKWLEAMVQFTHKKGNETKNFYSSKINDIDFCGKDSSKFARDVRYPNLCGLGRVLPDSVDFKSISRLAKFGSRFNDSSFVNLFYEDFKQEYFTEEKSNSTAGGNRKNTIDKIPYTRYGFYYEYTPNNDEFLAYLKAQFSKQFVKQNATANQYFAFDSSAKDATSLNGKSKQYVKDYLFSQDKTQIDINGIFNEMSLLSSSHILSFGLGRHFGNFKNENRETEYKVKYEFGPATGYQTKYLLDRPFDKSVKDFTYQEPVKSELNYIYLNDDFSLNDSLNLNLGLRFDKYHYKPQISNLPFENRQQKPENLPDSKFKALTYQASAEYEFLPNATINYGFSTGFKAPKVEEMYFRMKGAGTTIYERNLDLKPERAQNHELILSYGGENFALSFGGFYSKYEDFIDYEYKPVIQESTRFDFLTGQDVKTYRLSSIAIKPSNIQRAYIKGIELNSRLNLPNGLFLTLKSTYASGKKSDKTSMLAVNPINAILGLGYSDSKLDILLTGRFVAAKKAKDTMSIVPPNSQKVSVDRNTGRISGLHTKPEPHIFLSSGYSVYDLTASYKISKNLSVNFGLFNVFNKKYYTWENLRQLRYNGNQSYISFDGRGKERYSAPGRNFAVSVEARF